MDSTIVIATNVSDSSNCLSDRGRPIAFHPEAAPPSQQQPQPSLIPPPEALRAAFHFCIP